jgi:hypothetical protein
MIGHRKLMFRHQGNTGKRSFLKRGKRFLHIKNGWEGPSLSIPFIKSHAGKAIPPTDVH